MTDAWSITDGYWDVEGEWHPTPPATHDALRAAMGADDARRAAGRRAALFVRSGEHHQLLGHCDVVLEDGTVLHDLTTLPPELPHRLPRAPAHRRRSGGPGSSSPRRGRRSRSGRGVGPSSSTPHARSGAGASATSADLRELATWSAGMGAKVAMINPLHAPPPSPHHDPSPYFPTSRIYRNLLFLRIEDDAGRGARCPTSPAWPTSAGPSTPGPPSTAPRSTG